MKKVKFHCNKVSVGDAGRKGLGVFARAAFVEGEVIEYSPVICLRREETEAILKTKVGDYAFALGRERVGIGLGCLSLYNHSRAPNAEFESSPAGIRIVALKDIPAGEEVVFDYRWSDAELRKAGVPVDA